RRSSDLKQISVQRGYDVTRYTLACFGGAGGQHACLVADALGMTTVFIHPLSGLLSAYGMKLATLRSVRQRALGWHLEGAEETIERALDELNRQAMAELRAQGAEFVAGWPRVHIRY